MLTLPNGTVLTQVTRASCLQRVRRFTDHDPPIRYPYSQTRIEPLTGKRADCTGWVCEVLDTPDKGQGIYLNAYNSASLVTELVLRRITWAELKPGDVVGYCSPTSPGNGGHAGIFMGGSLDATNPRRKFWVCDHGSGMGPVLREVGWNGTSTGWLHPDHLAPWRYVAIEEDDMQLSDKYVGVRWEPGTVGELYVQLAARTNFLANVANLPARLDAILAKVSDPDDNANTLDPAAAADLAAIRAAMAALPDALADELAARVAE